MAFSVVSPYSTRLSDVPPSRVGSARRAPALKFVMGGRHDISRVTPAWSMALANAWFATTLSALYGMENILKDDVGAGLAPGSGGHCMGAPSGDILSGTAFRT